MNRDWHAETFLRLSANIVLHKEIVDVQEKCNVRQVTTFEIYDNLRKSIRDVSTVGDD